MVDEVYEVLFFFPQHHHHHLPSLMQNHRNGGSGTGSTSNLNPVDQPAVANQLPLSQHPFSLSGNPTATNGVGGGEGGVRTQPTAPPGIGSPGGGSVGSMSDR